MQRIDDPSNIASPQSPLTTVSPGYFRRPSVAAGDQGTILTADWANDVQENIVQVITSEGFTLSKGSASLLRNAIASMIDTDVAVEASARSSADSTLTTNLAAEVSNRIADVNAETTSRNSAISSEASARSAADSTLTTDLADEISTRSAVDNALASALSNEVTNRANAIQTHYSISPNESQAGHIEIASAAEALALVSNTRAITPHNLTDTFEIGSNANGNWVYLPTAAASASRIVVQWGSKAFSQTTTVTLPQTMSNTAYHVSTTVSGGSQAPNERTYTLTTTSFNYAVSNYNGTVIWLVFGLSA